MSLFDIKIVYENWKEDNPDLYSLMKECYEEKEKTVFEQTQKRGRDAARIPYILEEIEKMWRAHPDLRLGQLIMNAVDDGGMLYYLEDAELLAELRKEYENFNGDARQVEDELGD